MKSIYHKVDSIDWYCELRGSGPLVILIPSGEGDCSSFERVATTLAIEFTVLTFDMPGFSRSTASPNFGNYSIRQVTNEVAALVRSLGVGPATFYGSSSGGQVALCLVVEHPSLVRNVAVHEVPLSASDGLLQLTTLSDEEIVLNCKEAFRNRMNANGEAWDALGEAFHQRLAQNYITWVRYYIAQKHFLRSFTADELRHRPISWTIGGLTPAVAFFDNVVLAHAAGIQVSLLMCKHFPQVSIPEQLVEHIRKVQLTSGNPG